MRPACDERIEFYGCCCFYHLKSRIMSGSQTWSTLQEEREVGSWWLKDFLAPYSRLFTLGKSRAHATRSSTDSRQRSKSARCATAHDRVFIDLDLLFSSPKSFHDASFLPVQSSWTDQMAFSNCSARSLLNCCSLWDHQIVPSRRSILHIDALLFSYFFLFISF